MATMSIKGPATLQDLLNTPRDGRKYELVDGEILVSPAGMRHSEVGGAIFGLIWEFLQGNPIGKVYTSDVGIAFPNGNVRSPDVTYVSLAKLPGGVSPETFGEVIPDLAVEVIGDSQSHSDLARKALEYLGAGATLVWVVDPEPMRVVVYSHPNHVRVLNASDTLDGGDLLPGFSCKVAELLE